MKKVSAHPVRDGILSWAKALGCAFVMALLINNFVVVNASVLTGSMESTIMAGDRVFCNRIAYYTGDPQRFDVVIFDTDLDEYPYVKRVIGLPGEKVEIVDGKVYINDAEKPLPDDFVNKTPTGDFGPFQIPQGHYFVLGDNRNNSYDSKSWDDPYVAREQILGKAVFSYYPNFKVIEHINP